MPQIPRKNRNKPKSKALLLKTAAVLLLLCAVINILRIAFVKRPETTLAVSGSIEDSIDATGYIFKDITLVTPEVSGYLESVADEGEKVALNETIALVYQSEGDYEQKKELQDVEKQIAELEGKSNQKEIYASDTARIEQNISQEIRNFSNKLDKSPAALSTLKEDINKLITKKMIADGKLDGSQTDLLSSLYERRSALSASGNIQGFEVKAPVAGMYSARVSAMESELLSDNVKSLLPSDIDRLDKIVKDGGTEVSEDNTLKIVTDFKWYFVTVVDESVTQKIKAGQSVKLRFFDVTDRTVDGEIAYISGIDGGRAVVAISSEQYVDSIYSAPRASVEIVLSSYSGIKVPTESIRVVDGVRGVYVIRNGYTKFVEADILYSGKEQSVVKSDGRLATYDNVVTKYADIQDGMAVR